MATVDALLDCGITHHQAGRFEQAKQTYEGVLQLDPDQPDALHLMGMVQHQLGDHASAVQHIHRALRAKPNEPVFLANLGAVFHEMGRLEEAATTYRLALQVSPAHAETHRNLGITLRNQGKLDEAVLCYRRAIRLQPNAAPAHENLGVALRDLGKLDEAVTCFRRALELRPDYADAHNGLGVALTELGRPVEGISNIKHALRLGADSAETHNALGAAWKDLGNFEEAVACFERALQLNPDFSEAYFGLVQAKRNVSGDRETRDKLEQLLVKNGLSQSQRSQLHFALGKLHDDCERWDLAFEHYCVANALAEVQFDPQVMVDYVNATIETCTVSLLDRQGTSSGIAGDLPVFVVGMPRSGTTLVEQILASHPDVYGAGERVDIGNHARTLGDRLGTEVEYPDCLDRMDSDAAAAVAREYLAGLRELCPDATRTTDKMPGNFKHLGWISLLLPGARIIHCRRDPVDTCLSCFFQKFNAGGHGYSYNLTHLGHYYRQYARLMAHWRAVLTLPMFEVDYEDLVSRQEDVSRQLIEFCGLPWDPACLEFYRSDRSVRTASKWQVRQPVYARSVGRWKNYESHLSPLKQALESSSHGPGASPTVSVELLNASVAHHQAGRLHQAEQGYRQVLKRTPTNADALHLLGLVLSMLGKHDAAIEYVRQAVELCPSSSVYLTNLGAVFLAAGKFERAEATLRQALIADPDFAEAHCKLAIALKQLSRLDEAAGSCREAVRIAPDDALAHYQLGLILLAQHRAEEAMPCFQAAIRLKADFAEAHLNLGVSHQTCGDISDAAACYKCALAIKPDYAEAYNNLGNARLEQGKLGEAIANFKQAVEFKSDYATAHMSLAKITQHSPADQHISAELDRLLAGGELAREQRSQVHLALGKIHDDCGNWGLAFSHYQRANALTDVNYDPSHDVALADSIIETCTRTILDCGTELGNASQLPIFIVGMPRSGTSLVEQILASHPSVFGAGELPSIAQATGQLASNRTYPASLRDLDSATADGLAVSYLAQLQELAGGAERVTDKMPTNFWHLGLVALILPCARIIHCRRHPLDVCLSCYFTAFTNRDNLSFTFDLECLGRYYQLYAKLMDHWRNVLPLRLLEVDYEDLVRNQEEVSRGMIEFCDLPWNPACLAFHETHRIVRTASNAQVRQPIYERSVGRWRHYEPQLQFVKDMLHWPN